MTNFILALIFLFIFIVWSQRSLVYGLAIIIFLLPSYLWRLSIFGLPTTFLELMIITLFLLWLLKDKKYLRVNFLFSANSFNPVPRTWRWLLISWLMVSILAVAANPTWSSLGLWRAYFLEPLMFFLIFIYSVRSQADKKILVYALAGLVLWLFLVTIYQALTDWHLPVAYQWPNARRLTGIFSYPNALALLLAPVASFFLGLWIQSKNKLKNIFFLLIFVLGSLTSYLARSEGALVGLTLSLLFLLILAPLNNTHFSWLAKNIRKIVLPIIFLFLLFFIFFGYPISRENSFKQQLLAPQLDLQATSLEIRSSQWRETISFLRDHAFWGAGLAGYQSAIKPYHRVGWLEIYLYPHNIFLNFWSELGLLGLLLFLVIFFYIIITLYKLHKKNNYWAWPLILFFITWSIHGLVDVPYFKNDLSVLFFIFLGFLLLASGEEGQTDKQQFT